MYFIWWAENPNVCSNSYFKESFFYNWRLQSPFIIRHQFFTKPWVSSIPCTLILHSFDTKMCCFFFSCRQYFGISITTKSASALVKINKSLICASVPVIGPNLSMYVHSLPFTWLASFIYIKLKR